MAEELSLLFCGKRLWRKIISVVILIKWNKKHRLVSIASAYRNRNYIMQCEKIEEVRLDFYIIIEYQRFQTE